MEQEILDTITKVAKLIAPKYTFAYYGKDDLIQEAIIMGIDAYNRWDKKRPFENFVARHISNRLKTLKRDKFYRSSGPDKISNAQAIKKSIVQPERIGLELKKSKDEPEQFPWDEIDLIIPFSLRKDYLRLRAGVKISSSVKNSIMLIIKNYVEKNW